MDLADLVRRTRSYRRFAPTPLSHAQLAGWVDLARQTASGGNQQPLKYLVYHSEADCARIFPHLAWAAALKEWDGPVAGERPTGYILLLHDQEVGKGVGLDPGIAAQTIALAAMAQGVGSCMIGNVARTPLARELGIPERYKLALVIALGYPGETIQLDTRQPDQPVTYYRDENDVHHVPKRPLDEVLLQLD